MARATAPILSGFSVSTRMIEIRESMPYDIMPFMKNLFVIGHRGACAFLPENTMESFRLAFQQRADMIEFDVHLSKDGIPVILHDAALERTTDGRGYVSHLTVKELKNFNAGGKFSWKQNEKQRLQIPTLEEILREFTTQGLAVEIKERSADLTHRAVALIRKYQAQSRCIVGSRYDIVSKTMKQHPEIRRFLSRNEFIFHYLDYKRGNKKIVADVQAIASMPLKACGWALDDQAFIDYLHRRGIAVFYWTVNDPEVMQVLARKGADGIITNDPALCKKVLSLEL